jgi:hypothetical protein
MTHVPVEVCIKVLDRTSDNFYALRKTWNKARKASDGGRAEQNALKSNME